jgi:hypothetical protein
MFDKTSVARARLNLYTVKYDAGGLTAARLLTATPEPAAQYDWSNGKCTHGLNTNKKRKKEP